MNLLLVTTERRNVTREMFILIPPDQKISFKLPVSVKTAGRVFSSIPSGMELI